ncbi:MAG: hypothetical protein JNL58_31885 [Planctomyces sp.]|nr:hypothetical protein [Planctomyces sp.]
MTDFHSERYSEAQCADFRELPPERAAELKLLGNLICKLIKSLTREEQVVIELRFGFCSEGITYTLEECGRILNCTRERVRGVEYKAITKLSHPSRSRLLQPYLHCSTPDSR